MCHTIVVYRFDLPLKGYAMCLKMAEPVVDLRVDVAGGER
jgi:hypothetical protein